MTQTRGPRTQTLGPGSRILVTGAGGFIGSHVTEALLGAGHKVRALVRYSSTAGTGHLQHLHKQAHGGLEIVYGDVTNSTTTRLAAQGCEGIVHLAALIGIPYSYRAPESYVAVNVTGTLNVLEAAKQCRVSRVVIASTSEVYGSAQYVPIDENHPLQAQSPYSATKIAADALAIAYHRSFDLPVVVIRPFNTYGPRQSMRAVIPTVLTQLLSGADSLRIGSLSPRRDFTFVTDTAAAFAAALVMPGLEGATIHLGSGLAVSIGELVDRCQRIVGTDVPVVTDGERHRPDNSEVSVLLSDPTRAANLLGWKSATDLDTGLAATAASITAELSLTHGRGAGEPDANTYVV